MDHSTDDKDATRMLGTRFVDCGLPPVHVHDTDMPGQHRDASGRLKDTSWYTDLVETLGRGLRILIFLADVSLLIREFY